MKVAAIGLVAPALVLSLLISMVGFSLACTQKTKIDRRSPSIGEKQKPNKDASKKPAPDDPSSPGNARGQTDASVEINPIKSGSENLAKGKSLYQVQCSQCHPTLNQGEIHKFKVSCKTCSNYDDFVTKVVTTMPLGKVGSCDRDCARAIGAYLFTPL